MARLTREQQKAMFAKQNKPSSSSGRLTTDLDYRIENERNYDMVVHGETGSGKSTFAMAVYWETYKRAKKILNEKDRDKVLERDAKNVSGSTIAARHSSEIDQTTKRYTKKELIDEIDELGLRKKTLFVLHKELKVKHPKDPNNLEGYSHRAIAAASFVVNKKRARS